MKEWRQVRMWRLSRLCQAAPERLRWRWRKVTTGKRIHLQLVSPRGALWDFRLMNGGAWIKPAETEQKDCEPT